MAPIDWALLGAYLVLTLVLGLWLARRNSGEEDYFVAGRRLSGWLAGASMAATTFSIDTPLYVAGLIGSRGLAGNWEWWSFGLAHVAMAVVFAPLWRRSVTIASWWCCCMSSKFNVAMPRQPCCGRRKLFQNAS